MNRKQSKAWKILHPKPEHDIHRVYHRFCDIFGDGTNIPWKYKGYELMKRVQRWSKYYPDDVHVLSCDDNHHCGSSLVLIQHKAKSDSNAGIDWFGVTVVYIPQCSGEDPIEFFLYPNHQEDLEKALKCIRINVRNMKGWKL